MTGRPPLHAGGPPAHAVIVSRDCAALVRALVVAACRGEGLESCLALAAMIVAGNLAAVVAVPAADLDAVAAIPGQEAKARSASSPRWAAATDASPPVMPPVVVDLTGRHRGGAGLAEGLPT